MMNSIAAVTPDGAHALTMRVYYEDTDAFGVVYYANYLKFAERGRSEMLYGLGWDHRSIAAQFDAAFAVRRCEVDYLKPARLGDMIEVRSRFGNL